MARINTARCRLAGGLLAVALLAMTACTSQRPVHVMMDHGDREMALGHYDVAAAEYTEVVERYGGDWEAQYKLGQCHLELGNYRAARTALEVAASLRPQRDDIAEALAETMHLQGDRTRLFAFLRERAEARQTAEAYLRYAHYAIAESDADTAKLALDTAITLDDGQGVKPYLKAAEFARSIGDLELAIRRLRQAYAIDPHNRHVKDQLVAMGETPGPSIALPPGR